MKDTIKLISSYLEELEDINVEGYEIEGTHMNDKDYELFRQEAEEERLKEIGESIAELEQKFIKDAIASLIQIYQGLELLDIKMEQLEQLVLVQILKDMYAIEYTVEHFKNGVVLNGKRLSFAEAIKHYTKEGVRYGK